MKTDTPLRIIICVRCDLYEVLRTPDPRLKRGERIDWLILTIMFSHSKNKNKQKMLEIWLLPLLLFFFFCSNTSMRSPLSRRESRLEYIGYNVFWILNFYPSHDRSWPTIIILRVMKHGEPGRETGLWWFHLVYGAHRRSHNHQHGRTSTRPPIGADGGRVRAVEWRMQIKQYW